MPNQLTSSVVINLLDNLFIWPNVSVNSKHYHPQIFKNGHILAPGNFFYQIPIDQASLEPLILINFTLLRHIQDLNH